MREDMNRPCMEKEIQIHVQTYVKDAKPHSQYKNPNYNYHEISLCTYQTGKSQKICHHVVLVQMWGINILRHCWGDGKAFMEDS